MKKVNFKMQKVNSLLKIGLLILILKTFLSVSVVFPYSNTADTVLSILGAACFVITILRQRYDVNVLIIYGAIIIFVGFVCYRVQNMHLLITVLTIMAIRQTDFNKIVSFIFQYELFFFIIVVTVGIVLTICTDKPLYVVKFGTTRYSLGFVHPNTLSAILINLLLMWLWLNFDKINSRKLLAIIVVEVIFYAVTKTRTSLITLLFVISLVALCDNDKHTRLLRFVTMTIVPFLSTLFYVASRAYTKGYSVLLLIDRLLSSRIRLGAYAYFQKGITFFGQNFSALYDKVYWDPIYRLNNFTFDCFYTYALMNIGIVVLITISLVFFFLARKSDNKLNIFLISWAMYSITEVYGTNCYLSFSILLIVFLFGTYIGKGNKSVDELV